MPDLPTPQDAAEAALFSECWDTVLSYADLCTSGSAAATQLAREAFAHGIREARSADSGTHRSGGRRAFAGAVSSFFPVANMVAVDYFGAHGPALGAYRSAQIGIGAAAGWLIGRIGETVGLRSTLLVAVASPLLLVVVLQRRTDTSAG